MKRKKPGPLIIFLGAIFLLLLIGELLRNVKIYIVYRADIFPFIFGTLILSAMIILYLRR